jgi:hypothetical protein
MENLVSSSTSTISIPEIVDKTKKYVIDYLLPIIQSIGEHLEGNIFYYHTHTPDYIFEDYVQKHHNLVEVLLTIFKLMVRQQAQTP